MYAVSSYIYNFERLLISFFYFSLLKEGEIERWVGMYANEHTHMGNRTSGRAESFHSILR